MLVATKRGRVWNLIVEKYHLFNDLTSLSMKIFCFHGSVPFFMLQTTRFKKVFIENERAILRGKHFEIFWHTIQGFRFEINHWIFIEKTNHLNVEDKQIGSANLKEVFRTKKKYPLCGVISKLKISSARWNLAVLVSIWLAKPHFQTAFSSSTCQCFDNECVRVSFAMDVFNSFGYMQLPVANLVSGRKHELLCSSWVRIHLLFCRFV